MTIKIAITGKSGSGKTTLTLHAIAEIQRQYTAAHDEYIMRRNQTIKLDETLDKVYSLLSKADDLMESWKSDISDNPGITVTSGYYGSLSRKIHAMCNMEEMRSSIVKDFTDNSETLSNLKSKREDTMREVNKNYINVIANVKNIKNAKAAVEYLKELGFDLSALLNADANPVSTALSVEVDTKYLFIGGKKM